MAAGVGRVPTNAGISVGRGLLSGLLESRSQRPAYCRPDFPDSPLRGKGGCYMRLPGGQYNQPWPSPPRRVTLPLTANRAKGGVV